MFRVVVVLLTLSFVFVSCDMGKSPTEAPAETQAAKLIVNADPDSVLVNAPGAAAIITAQALDANDHPLGAGHEVRFSTSIGEIEETALTGENGSATARFIPGDAIGIAEIGATIQSVDGPITGGGRVCVLDPAKPIYIQVEVEPSFISVRGVGGVETAVITATVCNGIGQPVTEEYNVDFEIINEPNPPEGCILNGEDQNERVETVDGVAVAGLNAGTMIGAKLIRISTRDDDNNVVASIVSKVAVISGPPFQLDIDVNDRGYEAGGGAWIVEVSARVWDIHRNPVSDGIPVVFTVDPEIANISISATGGENRAGEAVSGLAFADLVYQSVNTFDPITISAEIHTQQGQIQGSREHILPLQRGEISLNVDPQNWQFNEDNPDAVVRCWATVKDGHGILINNAPVVFTSTHSWFYWRDFSNDEFIQFFPEPARKYTGVVDRQNDEAPGQATVYLLSEEEDIFIDPFDIEKMVTIRAAVDGYDFVQAEPKYIYFSRIDD